MTTYNIFNIHYSYINILQCIPFYLPHPQYILNALYSFKWLATLALVMQTLPCIMRRYTQHYISDMCLVIKHDA